MGLWLLVAIHKDLLEEHLVEELLDVVRCVLISPWAILEKVKSQCENPLDIFVVVVELLCLTVHPLESCCDSILFSLKEIKWNRVGIVCLEQSLLFAFELGPLESKLSELVLCVAATCEKFTPHLGLSLLPELGSDSRSHGIVKLLHTLLDGVNQHGSLLASVALPRVTTCTNEVRVKLAGFGSSHLDNQSRTALTAVDGALQKVIVDLSALAKSARSEDGLHEFPRFHVDQGLMATRIGHPLKPDYSCVIGIGQDLL